jgi:tRNA pseudouridine55 synthase
MSRTLNRVNGLVLVDKCAGPTSHAVVSAFKRALHPERIGHLGTLDPFASGLLPIMLGGATRLADEAMDGRKGYLFTVVFGHETDTLDPSGRIVREAPFEQVSAAGVEDALAAFRGAIEQTPPAYSALKLNGRPLYEYMRAEGKLPVDIETKRRTVVVESFDLVDFSTSEDGHKRAILRVRCGKGTYVRCLARDIAAALGSAGTCETLRREFVEPWSVDDSNVYRFTNEGPLDPERLIASLQPPRAMVPHLPELTLPADPWEKKLLSGNFLVLPATEVPCRPEGVQMVKALVRAGHTLYLAELGNVGDTVKVQPRKMLDWR